MSGLGRRAVSGLGRRAVSGLGRRAVSGLGRRAASGLAALSSLLLVRPGFGPFVATHKR